MEIRRTHPDDITEISLAEAEIFSDPWTREAILEVLSSEGAMCYTAKKDGKVAAYVIGRVIYPEGEIYRIATAPDMRGRGVAFRLLSFALKTERGRGLENTFLEVRSRNVPARALYTACKRLFSVGLEVERQHLCKRSNSFGSVIRKNDALYPRFLYRIKPLEDTLARLWIIVGCEGIVDIKYKGAYAQIFKMLNRYFGYAVITLMGKKNTHARTSFKLFIGDIIHQFTFYCNDG